MIGNIGKEIGWTLTAPLRLPGKILARRIGEEDAIALQFTIGGIFACGYLILLIFTNHWLQEREISHHKWISYGGGSGLYIVIALFFRWYEKRRMGEEEVAMHNEEPLPSPQVTEPLQQFPLPRSLELTHENQILERRLLEHIDFFIENIDNMYEENLRDRYLQFWILQRNSLPMKIRIMQEMEGGENGNLTTFLYALDQKWALVRAKAMFLRALDEVPDFAQSIAELAFRATPALPGTNVIRRRNRPTFSLQPSSSRTHCQ